MSTPAQNSTDQNRGDGKQLGTPKKRKQNLGKAVPSAVADLIFFICIQFRGPVASHDFGSGVYCLILRVCWKLKERTFLGSALIPNIGWGCGATDEQLQPPDKVTLLSLSRQGISDKVVENYNSGRSLREISKEIGLAKSTILKALKRAGVPLRPSNADYQKGQRRPPRPNVGTTPYGFARLRGKLVVDAREIETLRLIIKLWQSGKTFHAIAVHLNSQGIKPRKGKAWQYASIKSVIQHQKADLNRIEEIITWASKN